MSLVAIGAKQSLKFIVISTMAMPDVAIRLIIQITSGYAIVMTVLKNISSGAL